MNSRQIPLAVFALLAAAFAARGAAAQASPIGTWQRLGPSGGEVVSIAAASDATLYLGTPDGHVFTSADRAEHWELRGRVAAPQTARIDGVVQRIIVDIRAPQRLFAAVWFQDPAAGGGIYRSEDAGRTWSLAGLRGEAVRALEQSSAQPEIFVAGTRTGVFRSADAGQSWERISPPGDAELRNLDSLAFDPRDPRIIYAGTYHLPWKTTDAGKTWAPVSAGMIDDSDVMSLRVDLTNPARLFASACSGIYRSENGGAQWTKLEGVPYAARRTQAIVQDPADSRVLYAGTTEGLWATRDAGESWTRVTPRDWVINGIVVLPATPAGASRPASSRIVIATESQGIQISDDAGLHFAAANAGFAHRVVAAFAADPSQPGHWLARIALPGATLVETRDAGQSWQPLADPVALRSTTQIFGTPAGWFAAPAEGGLFHYDSAAQLWRPLRFVLSNTLAPPPKATPAKRIKLAAPHELNAPEAIKVRALRLDGSRLWVATDHGIWSGELAADQTAPSQITPGQTTARDVGENILRSAHSPAAPPDTLAIDFCPAPASGELWSVTGESIMHSSDAGKSWQAEPPPPDAGALRWIRWVPGADPYSTGRGTLLLGAVNGVFSQPSGTRDWHRLAAGLPAAETLPPTLLAPSAWILSSKTAGLYLSQDRGATWQRLDGLQETSRFIASAAATSGTFAIVAASRSEGVLVWVSAQ